MTTEEENQKIVQSIANATFQSLTLNGLIHAAKYYSIKEAERKLQELNDETREKLIQEIKAADTPSEPPTDEPPQNSPTAEPLKQEEPKPDTEDSPEEETA